MNNYYLSVASPGPFIVHFLPNGPDVPEVYVPKGVILKASHKLPADRDLVIKLSIGKQITVAADYVDEFLELLNDIKRSQTQPPPEVVGGDDETAKIMEESPIRMLEAGKVGITPINLNVE